MIRYEEVIILAFIYRFVLGNFFVTVISILGIGTQREKWLVLEDFIQLCSATWTLAVVAQQSRTSAHEQEAKWQKQRGPY